MALDIPLDKAAIVSTVLEAILYGFSLLMFGGTIWALAHGRTGAKINKLMLSVAILLLILSSSHMVIDVIRIEQGFVTRRDTIPGGPLTFFADVSQPTFVVKNAIYTLQTLLGDGVVIYRCYVVWQSIWIIALPSLLLCILAVVGVGALYAVSHATTTAGNIFAPVTARWITSCYVTTLSTNLLATILLSYRLWKIDRNLSHIRANRGPLRPLLEIVLDAGLLYSVTLLATLSCFVAKSTGQYVTLDMIPPIISIAFYMVIIRVELSKTRNKSMGLSAHSARYKDRHGIPTNQYPMNSVQVHITTLSEMDNSSPQPSNSKFDLQEV